MDIFEHVSVPQHKILSRVDEKQALSDLRVQRHQLPKAHVGDAVCVILGAEIDDVIQIDAFNENSGIERRYRLVV